MKIDIKDIIRKARVFLGETQEQFGARFNVGKAAVSNWEEGRREAPYMVIESCFEVLEMVRICDKCNGTGFC